MKRRHKHTYRVRLIDRESKALYLPTIRFRGKRRVEVSQGLLMMHKDADPEATVERLTARLELLVMLLHQRRTRQEATE